MGGEATARWWRRPVASAPLRPTLAVFAVLLVPAVLGAVFAWAWWLTLSLMLPGVVLIVRLGHIGAERRGIRSRSDTPTFLYGVLGASGGPLAVLMTSTLDRRYWGVGLFALAVAVEGVMRLWWRHHERRRVRAAPQDGVAE